ncbi:LysM peptidoglycan-binding domain-containing protein [Candidatus Kaiserbacteria bacterium]|nr:LysM peptidoglycan-binding domain-containing protein [Candidatus Kaiserbacteria bacterium]
MNILPNHASAFWPFYTNADASANTFIPTTSTPVLTASTNSNPTSSAPIALITSGGAALISYNGPDGTTAAVTDTTQNDRISVYVVRSGDTLSDIARMYDVSTNTILWANNLKSARDVHPGDTLIILPVSGVERTIVKGDTLKSLATKYSADAEEIAQYNGLDPADILEIGSTIIIPGGEIVAPAPRPQPSQNTPVMLGGGGSFIAGYYSSPVPGGRITQRIHGKNGADIGAARGTPIRAAANGVVIIARGSGTWNGGYGNYVVVTHDNGTQTLYSHLRSVTASPGQSVSSGQIIGYMGSTGKATGVHLHFEVRGAANPFRNCSIGSFCAPQ